ncbi:non-homologous end-joining DNA ligase [Pendulispora rubella]|uniref:Non-homologous end-joining DNA ligase n=1 Tax=Pendulispora rubella TaxID=2741070 RepID=A0ABZ2KXT5_9BACT
MENTGQASGIVYAAENSLHEDPPASSTQPAPMISDEPIPRIPIDRSEAMLELSGHRVRLTNLQKVFFPLGRITKGALLQYYLDVAPVLLPHTDQRAMVMKRYPNGMSGKFFFMKRAPAPRPKWIRTCPIEHTGAGVIEFPIVGDVATLAWMINLGCIDLNPWYARADDIERPDYLHFDLDPGEATFERTCEVALVVHEALSALGMPNYVKTSGSRGLHVFVPIVRGPTQQDVWSFARDLARDLAERHPKIITAESRIAKRPPGRVLIDYNQNVWGRTIASVYSVRPMPRATVSTPVTWAEVAEGISIEAFRLENVPARVRKLGDLWAPLAPSAPDRYDLSQAGVGEYVPKYSMPVPKGTVGEGPDSTEEPMPLPDLSYRRVAF